MQIQEVMNDSYNVVDENGNILFSGNKYLCECYIKLRE